MHGALPQENVHQQARSSFTRGRPSARSSSTRGRPSASTEIFHKMGVHQQARTSSTRGRLSASTEVFHMRASIKKHRALPQESVHQQARGLPQENVHQHARSSSTRERPSASTELFHKRASISKQGALPQEGIHQQTRGSFTRACPSASTRCSECRGTASRKTWSPDCTLLKVKLDKHQSS